ncbi:MAG: CHAD domain-containing protein [Candidatus Cyclobacteriaceae bacterium M3_2C_046]
MGYKIDIKDQTTGAGLKRIAHEQLGKALYKLNHLDHNHQEVVHDTRKRFKKLRALLRMVKEQAGKKYRKQNGFYRNLSRKLSAVRDTVSTLKIAQKTYDKFPDLLSETDFLPVKGQLEERKQDLESKHLKEQDVLTQVRSNLIDGIEMTEKLPVEKLHLDDLGKNLNKVYQRGYKSFRTAYKEPSDENFHEFRKRVKYLWYHTRIYGPIWKKYYKGVAAELKQLSDYLGDDHDLSVLKEILENNLETNPEQMKHWLTAIEAFQKELRLKALTLSARIYYRKPKKHLKKIIHDWRQWKKEKHPEVKKDELVH